MTPEYHQYPESFKREAVRLAEERNKPVTDIARELGIRVNLIYKWKKQLAKQAQSSPQPSVIAVKKRHPHAHLLVTNQAELDEISRLKKHIERLEAEKDMLKKAAAYFAKELV